MGSRKTLQVNGMQNGDWTGSKISLDEGPHDGILNSDSRYTLFLIRKQLAEETSPIFNGGLASRSISENTDVKFTCTISGHPEPEVLWYKDDEQLDRLCGLPKYEIRKEGKVHFLKLFSCMEDDAAIYQVSARNHKGIVSCSAVLEVGTMTEYKIHLRWFDRIKRRAEARKHELGNTIPLTIPLQVGTHRMGKENKMAVILSGTMNSPEMRTTRKRRSPELRRSAVWGRTSTTETPEPSLREKEKQSGINVNGRVERPKVEENEGIVEVNAGLVANPEPAHRKKIKSWLNGESNSGPEIQTAGGYLRQLARLSQQQGSPLPASTSIKDGEWDDKEKRKMQVETVTVKDEPASGNDHLHQAANQLSQLKNRMDLRRLKSPVYQQTNANTGQVAKPTVPAQQKKGSDKISSKETGPSQNRRVAPQAAALFRRLSSTPVVLPKDEDDKESTSSEIHETESLHLLSDSASDVETQSLVTAVEDFMGTDSLLSSDDFDTADEDYGSISDGASAYYSFGGDIESSSSSQPSSPALWDIRHFPVPPFAIIPPTSADLARRMSSESASSYYSLYHYPLDSNSPHYLSLSAASDEYFQTMGQMAGPAGATNSEDEDLTATEGSTETPTEDVDYEMAANTQMVDSASPDMEIQRQDALRQAGPIPNDTTTNSGTGDMYSYASITSKIASQEGFATAESDFESATSEGSWLKRRAKEGEDVKSEHSCLSSQENKDIVNVKGISQQRTRNNARDKPVHLRVEVMDLPGQKLVAVSSDRTSKKSVVNEQAKQIEGKGQASPKDSETETPGLSSEDLMETASEGGRQEEKASAATRKDITKSIDHAAPVTIHSRIQKVADKHSSRKADEIAEKRSVLNKNNKATVTKKMQTDTEKKGGSNKGIHSTTVGRLASIFGEKKKQSEIRTKGKASSGDVVGTSRLNKGSPAIDIVSGKGLKAQPITKPSSSKTGIQEQTIQRKSAEPEENSNLKKGDLEDACTKEMHHEQAQPVSVRAQSEMSSTLTTMPTDHMKLLNDLHQHSVIADPQSNIYAHPLLMPSFSQPSTSDLASFVTTESVALTPQPVNSISKTTPQPALIPDTSLTGTYDSATTVTTEATASATKVATVTTATTTAMADDSETVVDATLGIPSATPQELALGARRKVYIPRSPGVSPKVSHASQVSRPNETNVQSPPQEVPTVSLRRPGSRLSWSSSDDEDERKERDELGRMLPGMRRRTQSDRGHRPGDEYLFEVKDLIQTQSTISSKMKTQDPPSPKKIRSQVPHSTKTDTSQVSVSSPKMNRVQTPSSQFLAPPLPDALLPYTTASTIIGEQVVSVEDKEEVERPQKIEIKPDPFKAPQVIRKIRAEAFPDLAGNLKIWCQFFNVLHETSVCWTRNGSVIAELFLSAGEEVPLTLAIPQASRSDHGVYRCSVSNPYGSTSSELHLSYDAIQAMVNREEIQDGEEIEMTPLIFNKGLTDSSHWGERFFGRVITEERPVWLPGAGDGTKQRKPFRAHVVYGLSPIFDSGSTCMLKVPTVIAYGGCREPKPTVLNQHISVQDCKVQNTVREYCKQFSVEARAAEDFGEIPEVQPLFLIFRPASHIPYATLEAEMTGHVTFYPAESGSPVKNVNAEKTSLVISQESDAILHDKCNAFRHWLLLRSNGNLLLSNAEGIRLKLTNLEVSVRCADSGPELGCKANPQAISSFRAKHICNQYCKLLRLTSLAQQMSSSPQLGHRTFSLGARSPGTARKVAKTSPQPQRKVQGIRTSPQLARKTQELGTSLQPPCKTQGLSTNPQTSRKVQSPSISPQAPRKSQSLSISPQAPRKTQGSSTSPQAPRKTHGSSTSPQASRKTQGSSISPQAPRKTMSPSSSPKQPRHTSVSSPSTASRMSAPSTMSATGIAAFAHKKPNQ
uniref:non-specific serine/threonine protein kinase n=1 Tax=Eptatretus burgeri TaxID=7764 RepID=A0A8C4QF03_EPTBU